MAGERKEFCMVLVVFTEGGDPEPHEVADAVKFLAEGGTRGTAKGEVTVQAVLSVFSDRWVGKEHVDAGRFDEEVARDAGLLARGRQGRRLVTPEVLAGLRDDIRLPVLREEVGQRQLPVLPGEAVRRYSATHLHSPPPMTKKEMDRITRGILAVVASLWMVWFLWTTAQAILHP